MAEYFGPKWDAPITDGAVQVETPVGKPCAHCQEPIKDGESGIRNATFAEEGYEHSHKECMLRIVLGSPSHVDGECTTEGHAEDDKMTYREQALEVWRLVNERKWEGFHV